MNNVKISVLACLAFALCSLGSVEAGSDKKKCLNPIVTTWNVSITATQQSDPIPVAVLEGSATFHKDCTVVFATSPKNVEGGGGLGEPSLFAQFSTQSYGIWKQVGPCEYKVILSNTINDPTQPSPLPPARFKIEATIKLTNNCTKFDLLNGQITGFAITNICFLSPPPPSSITLTGQGCKLSFNC